MLAPRCTLVCARLSRASTINKPCFLIICSICAISSLALAFIHRQLTLESMSVKPKAQISVPLQHPSMNRFRWVTVLLSGSKVRQMLRRKRTSIVISTYNRYEHLVEALQHYGNSHIPSLDAIFICWGLGNVDPPKNLDLNGYRVPVFLERATRNDLSERFKRPQNMQTEVALWLDDDIRISPDGLEFAFQSWCNYAKAQHRIVGFSPRHYTVDRNNVYRYAFDQPQYSMVLTDSAFLDTAMLEWYWDESGPAAAARRYVSKFLNCEDILMNCKVVVASKTGLSPIFVDIPGEVQVVKAEKSIHHKPDHFYRRSKCIQKFVEVFGMTLQESAQSVARVRKSEREVVPLRALDDESSKWGIDKGFVSF